MLYLIVDGPNFAPTGASMQRREKRGVLVPLFPTDGDYITIGLIKVTSIKPGKP